MNPLPSMPIRKFFPARQGRINVQFHVKAPNAGYKFRRIEQLRNLKSNFDRINRINRD